MTFSFKASKNWYHDFPKLARESGFYFSVHTNQIHANWNRISSIDIDKVIRERDFQVVDENVNNVIDYYIESKYDVKILDSNFVKLFRLAQLAVEYLLYCKQYLDQSVVILKEELKYKIEENIKLKEEIEKLQNIIEEIREKYKEQYKFPETISNTYGEIHNCPWCLKTFIPTSFVNARLIRQNSKLSEALYNSPEKCKEYRAETEKLHSEIKTLKEKINETEQVIKNESRLNIQNEIAKKNIKIHSFEDDMLRHENNYKKYQEDMSDLKNLLFSEIKNLKSKEKNEHEMNQENIKELINQQEHEIKKLKIQLQQHFTSNINEIEVKLFKQEEYWKYKIKQFENQHRNDIENLLTQLKLAQESSVQLKSEYEDKILFLEKQSTEQLKLITTQNDQLKEFTRNLQNDENKKLLQNDTNTTQFNKQGIENFEKTKDIIDIKLRHNNKNKVFEYEKPFMSNLNFKNNHYKVLRNKSTNDSLKTRNNQKRKKEYNLSKNLKKTPETGLFCTKIIKNEKKCLYQEISENSESSNMESENEFDKNTDKEANNILKVKNIINDSDKKHLKTENKIIQPSIDINNCFTSNVKVIIEELQKTFYHKLKEYGIDPEWCTIPVITFRETLETINHQRNIVSNKFPKYEQIRKKLLEELTSQLYFNQKFSKKLVSEKKSSLKKKQVSNHKY